MTRESELPEIERFPRSQGRDPLPHCVCPPDLYQLLSCGRGPSPPLEVMKSTLRSTFSLSAHSWQSFSSGTLAPGNPVIPETDTQLAGAICPTHKGRRQQRRHTTVCSTVRLVVLAILPSIARFALPLCKLPEDHGQRGFNQPGGSAFNREAERAPQF